MENSVYSVISPESCAAIIYRDSGKAALAAAALKLTAPDLLSLGLIDGIVPEPGEGAHTDPDNAADALRLMLRIGLAELTGLSEQQLIRPPTATQALPAIADALPHVDPRQRARDLPSILNIPSFIRRQLAPRQRSLGGEKILQQQR